MQIYEDELKNISSLIQPPPGGNISTFQSEIENNFDKLQEIKIQAEKIIADDQLTKKTSRNFYRRRRNATCSLEKHGSP